MIPNERDADLPDLSPDVISPDQARRLRLWRAMADLAQAQADGRLSLEQLQVLEALSENLNALAAGLNKLAALGQQYAQALEAGESFVRLSRPSAMSHLGDPTGSPEALDPPAPTGL